MSMLPSTRRAFLTSLGAGVAIGAAPVSAVRAQVRPPAPPALDATAQLLKALSEAPGPSGFEELVREIVVGEFSSLGAAIEYDGLGSVLATLPGGASGPRIMVTAHLDEVGLMVQYVTADGFLRVKTLGGVLEQALPDQRWTILGRNGPVTAITGLRTTHVLPPSQRGVVWPLEEAFLDIGASSREEVERMGVRPGDGIAPLSDFHVMANGRYAGKAWDDRVGLGVMIAAARRIKAENIRLPAHVVWVATTQEEIGLRGAQTAVDKARPDLGISIEAGVSADYPAIGPDAGPGTARRRARALPARWHDDPQPQAARFLLRHRAAGADSPAAERPHGVRRGRRRDSALRHRPAHREHDGAHAVPARAHRHHPAIGRRPRRRSPGASADPIGRCHRVATRELRAGGKIMLS